MAGHITLARIQRGLDRAGIPLTMHRGEGYQYFQHQIAHESELDRSTSVYICHLNHLDLDGWIELARNVWSHMQETNS